MSDKVKVVLLNDGGYQGMQEVDFPVVVEGTFCSDEIIGVAGYELVRVGVLPEYFDVDELYCFVVGSNCEEEE